MPDGVTREIKEAIKRGFTDSQQAITRHTTEIVGQELGSAFEDVKKITGAAFSPFKSAFASLTGRDKDTPKVDKERNNLLQEMVDYFHEQEKARGRMFDPKEKKSPWYAILIGVGALVGAIAGQILLPFTLLFQALMKIKPIARAIDSIGDFFKNIIRLAKIRLLRSERIVGFFLKVTNWFKKIIGPFRNIFVFAERFGFGTLFSAFKTGFKFLAWPLQILLSAIDFIKGFIAAEGTLLDRIKGGMWGVIEGFVDLPVKLFGWLADWVLRQFGIEIEGGVGPKIMQGLRFIFDLLFKFYYVTIPNLIKEWIGKSIGFIGDRLSQLGGFEFFKDTFDKAKAVFKTIIDSYVNLFWSVIDFFKGIIMKLPDWIPGAETLKETLGELEGPSPSKEIEEMAKDKQRVAATAAVRRATMDEEQERKNEEMRKELKRASDVQIKTATALTGVTTTERRAEPEQIPDQTDNYLVGAALLGS